MKTNPIGNLMKTNPIQTQSNSISLNAKMNENLFATKDYENETAFRLEQNKPNLCGLGRLLLIGNMISDRPDFLLKLVMNRIS